MQCKSNVINVSESFNCVKYGVCDERVGHCCSLNHLYCLFAVAPLRNTANLVAIQPSLGQIGSLQATQMSHEATIRNLDQEQSRLKEKISRLEEEREALLNQSQAANEQHKQQVLKLEQVPPKSQSFRVVQRPGSRSHQVSPPALLLSFSP